MHRVSGKISKKNTPAPQKAVSIRSLVVMEDEVREKCAFPTGRAGREGL